MESHSEIINGDDESSSMLNDDSNKLDTNSSEFISSEENEDTRSELKFDAVLESAEEKSKRLQIEEVLKSGDSVLETWRRLALSRYGLVNDDLRRQVWPLLLNVDPDPSEKAPLLSELSQHSEYSQVVLDVNRSLKRFPPGIPYRQRLALQDQLTVLILRVIMKYPHLRYYQGYHDVAITFLLVVGETVAFRIMERLSTDHLRECMEPTMEKTSYTLTYIYPILQREDLDLYEFMDRAMVGTMFALPWYLTWFGHSLNQYRDVVRLYDYFLASPPLMPLYVTASLVIDRRQEVFDVGCDMASIHCLLSQIPDNLDFESILERASDLYKKYPPSKLEKDVKNRVQKELEQRRKDEARIRRRLDKNKATWVKMRHYLPNWLLLHYRNKYGLLFATATLLVGLYAYLRATETGFSLFKQGPWNI
ncbi:hypothetical protein PPYR_09277 [Photinus pyralis]|uniref:Rab-GAP TBC domain-containing protein n=1 Tax=Photinus pyralis TaxID=7054 RepID=A0A1Y1NEC9_PHOPY|nr:TBC1 domain family member 20 [Photinus pyralis]KAB0798284.1 hypothetical protein PPYR_09277 [Photinus pyralis]